MRRRFWLYYPNNRQILKTEKRNRVGKIKHLTHSFSITRNAIISILVSGELLQIPHTEHPLHATQKHKLNVLLLLKRLLFQSVVAGFAGGTTAASIHAVRLAYIVRLARSNVKSVFLTTFPGASFDFPKVQK